MGSGSGPPKTKKVPDPQCAYQEGQVGLVAEEEREAGQVAATLCLHADLDELVLKQDPVVLAVELLDVVGHHLYKC